MKRNLDSYGELFKRAVELSRIGKSQSEIAKMLGLPAQTISNWLSKGRRKTQAERFYEYLAEKGPVSFAEIRKIFPKHSDIFLKALARGFDIRKYDTGMKGELRFWYYLPKQEERMKEISSKLRDAIEKAKERIRERI